MKSHSWLSAPLLAGLITVGCGGDDEATLLASARKRVEKNDNVAAAIEMKTLLQGRPESAEGRFLLGKALLGTGGAAAAEAEFRRAREYGYPDRQVVPLLATAMLAMRQSKLLIQQYGNVDLQDDLANAGLKTQIALAHADNGDLGHAEEAVTAALQYLPGHLPAQLLRARLKVARGDVAAAKAMTDDLLARHPTNAQAWVLEGDLLQQVNADPAAPIAAYRKALTLRADSLPAHGALISMLIRQRDLGAAARQLVEMKKVLPGHPQTQFFDALLASLSGDAKRTREITQQLLVHSPDNPHLLLLAGQAAVQLNSLSHAETLLQKAVLAAPNAPEPRHQLAVVYLRGGQTDKALGVLTPLIATTSQDGDALVLAAQAYLVNGDVKNADASFARATKIKPDDAAIRTAKALALLARGQGDTALGDLQAIAEADTKGTAADLALISARLRRNELGAALKAVDALAAKQPRQALPDHLRGRIALLRLDVIAARKSFEQALAKDGRYLPSVTSLAELDLADNKPDAARSRFEALLQRDPDNAQAMLALAELSRRAGARTEEVARWLDKAIKVNPGDVTTQLAAIDHYLRAGEGKLARSAAQAAVAAQPNEPELLERMGLAQLATGEINQAILSFTKLEGLRPKSPVVQLRLADAYRAGQKSGEADAHVRRALELAPGWLPAQTASMAVAMREKQPAQALLLARAVQSQHPSEAVGFRLEGDIEGSQKNWDAAIAAFRKAVARSNPADAPARLHWALISARKAAEAAQFEQGWRKDHPDDAAFLRHLADTAMLRNDWVMAETRYREVLGTRPNDASALNNLAYLLIKLKKPGALPFAERAVALAPDQPAVLDTLALAYADARQMSKAIEWQVKAVALAPQTGGLRLNLAKLYLQADDKPRARTELDKLATLGPAFSAQDEVAQLLRQTTQTQ